MALSTAQRSKLFGPPGEVDRVTYVTPWGPKVVIHPQILARFRAACERAHATVKWTPRRIDSFNPRKIRGSDSWSLHAFALALDFFATPPNVPPPGGVWTPDDAMPPEFVACFTDLGFRWGGTFKRVDVPHIEWADGLPAPLTDAPPATFRGGTVILFHPKRPDVVDHFWTSPTGTVLHKWCEGWPVAPKWNQEDLGGRIVRDLGGARSADGKVVLLSGVGSDGLLWENAWTGQAWTGWSKVGG